MNQQRYEEAFRAVYPQVAMSTKVVIKRLQNGAKMPVLKVFINGTDDGRPLTTEEVDSAIADFTRNRHI